MHSIHQGLHQHPKGLMSSLKWGKPRSRCIIRQLFTDWHKVRAAGRDCERHGSEEQLLARGRRSGEAGGTRCLRLRVIATDCHLSVQRLMREEYVNITYDLRHIVYRVRKSLCHNEKLPDWRRTTKHPCCASSCNRSVTKLKERGYLPCTTSPTHTRGHLVRGFWNVSISMTQREKTSWQRALRRSSMLHRTITTMWAERLQRAHRSKSRWSTSGLGLGLGFSKASLQYGCKGLCGRSFKVLWDKFHPGSAEGTF